MKSNLALPGGLLTSKPTWSNTFGCSTTSALFLLYFGAGRRDAVPATVGAGFMAC
jgi:hypothetical protein